MTPSEIRESAFKHLKNVGRDTAVSMAAAWCVPVSDLIQALREPGDFRWIAGNGCWDYTLCPFARCRGDAEETERQRKEARRTQAAYNDVHAATESRPQVKSSQLLLDYVRVHPSSAREIARGLGWCMQRVYFHLHRLVERLKTFVRPGSRARIWSLGVG